MKKLNVKKLKIFCLLPCMIASLGAAISNEEKIRNVITQRAEWLMLTTFRKPPIALGNITTIHELLSQFDALQANHLTQEYHALIEQISQKAIADQHKHNYMAVLEEENFTIIMHRRTDNGIKLFLEKAVGDLEEIRETGRAVITPIVVAALTTAATVEQAIQNLRDEMKVREIIEHKGEQIMLAALRQPPIQLGNMTSINQVLEHLNALQAQHLTQEYKNIVKDVSDQAIKDQLEQDYMRVLSDETFKTIMESRIEAALKDFTPKVVYAIKEIRETGWATVK